MKHFRILILLLILALVFSACGSTVREPYDYIINNRTITVYPETGTIVDGLDVYHYTFTESRDRTDYVITYPNGARFNWTETKTGGHGGWDKGSESVLYLSGFSLVNALEAGQPRERSGNIGIGLLLMGLGAWYILSPESVFHLSKGWMFRDAEPSDSYLTLARISGAVLAILGLVVCIV